MADKMWQALLAAGSTNVNNLLLHHYHDLGMSTSQLMVYLELMSYIDQGVREPSLALIAKHLGTDEQQVGSLIHEMITQHLLAQRLETQPSGKQAAVYDFSPLWERLAQFIEQGGHLAPLPTDDQALTREKIFQQIQVEFGRTPSPFELEYINQWIDQDQYPLELIQLALKEAVVNGKYTLKYIDRILLRWQQNNITTPAQVRAEQRRFEQRQHGNDTGDGPVPPIEIIKLNE